MVLSGQYQIILQRVNSLLAPPCGSPLQLPWPCGGLPSYDLSVWSGHIWSSPPPSFGVNQVLYVYCPTASRWVFHSATDFSPLQPLPPQLLHHLCHWAGRGSQTLPLLFCPIGLFASSLGHILPQSDSKPFHQPLFLTALLPRSQKEKTYSPRETEYVQEALPGPPSP